MYTIIHKTKSRCIQLHVYQTSRIKSYFNATTCEKQASKLYTLHQNVQL